MPVLNDLPPLPEWYNDMYRRHLARMYDLIHEIQRDRPELRTNILHRQLTRG